MPTITRLKRTSRISIGPYKRHELLTCELRYANDYTGYGDGVGKNLADFVSDQMRVDWANNRDELIEFWQFGKSGYSTFPDSRPWLRCGGGCGGYHELPWAARHLDREES